VAVTPLLVRLDDVGDVVPQADTLEFHEDGLVIHRPTARSMAWRRLDPTELRTLHRLLASVDDLLGRDLTIEPVPLPGANPPGHGVTSYAFITPTKTNDGLAQVSTLSADSLEDEYWTPDERIDRLTTLARDLEALAAVDRQGWRPFPARRIHIFVGVRAPTSRYPATPLPGTAWPFAEPPESFGTPAKGTVVTGQWTSARGATLPAAEVDAAWKVLTGGGIRQPFMGQATVSVDGRIVDVIANELLPSEETND
jgi:hypothetical protein